MLTISVTRWLEYLSILVTFTAMTIWPVAYDIYRVSSKFCQRQLKPSQKMTKDFYFLQKNAKSVNTVHSRDKWIRSTTALLADI